MRILFIAMANSVHTARWISQISDQGWDLHVFDMKEGNVSPELYGVSTYTVHPPPREVASRVKWSSDYPFRRGSGLVRRSFPSFLTNRIYPSRVKALAKLIEELKPDIIHSLEMQNESYPLLEVRQLLGGSFSMPWIYSSWGSDIYHFIKFAEHQENIRNVLKSCDYHVSDCERDVFLARANGFSGEFLGIFPAPGSYDVVDMRDDIAIKRVSNRKSIAVKGYEHWAGRGLTAIAALEMCADALHGYTIELYLTDESVRMAAEKFAMATGNTVKIIPQSNNVEILKLFGRSRVGVGLSISDGTPNTMLETMVMGAFPIQSDTVSTAEWINHGTNGFLAPPEDAASVACSLRLALQDDELVDRAADFNEKLMLERIDINILKPRIVALYDRILKKVSRIHSGRAVGTLLC